MTNLTNSRIEITGFTPELAEPIKTLNHEWLQKYFRIEKSDEISLCNPQEHIIDKGGFIFYAKMEGKIVGTASLMKYAECIFELGKMAVSPKAQGHGVGTLLLETCIMKAKELRAEKLILYSNTKLQTALRLYRKYGFTEVKLEDGLYERANIKLEIELRDGRGHQLRDHLIGPGD